MLLGRLTLLMLFERRSNKPASKIDAMSLQIQCVLTKAEIHNLYL